MQRRQLANAPRQAAELVAVEAQSLQRRELANVLRQTAELVPLEAASRATEVAPAVAVGPFPQALLAAL